MKLELKGLGILSLLLATSTIFTSCLSTDDETPDYQPAGSVAFNNFSPGNDGLKFYSNGEAVHNGSLNYGQNFGFWRGEVGIHALTVNSGSTVLDTLNLTISPDRFYSVFAVNTPGNTELIGFEEQFIVPNTGKAAIRFFQLSPDAPTLKVSISGETANLGTYEFKQASGYMEINEVLNKKMYLIDYNTNDTIFSKNMNFTNGRLYSVVAKGLVNSTSDLHNLDIQVTPFSF
jgi:hypothetical protein